MTLEIMGSSKGIAIAGGNWQRGGSTTFKHFYRVVEAILVGLRPTYLTFPTGIAAKESAAEYKKLCGVPNIVVAVDGSHVKMRKPGNRFQHVYCNRKSTHSFNNQVCVTGKRKFGDCSVGYPGSMHDARMWRLSRVARQMQ